MMSILERPPALAANCTRVRVRARARVRASYTQAIPTGCTPQVLGLAGIAAEQEELGSNTIYFGDEVRPPYTSRSLP